jgi:hypothetical protein
MKLNKLAGLVVMATVLVGCLDVQISEPQICSLKSLGTVPGSALAGVSLPPLTLTQTVDLSSPLSKLSDVASSLTVSVNSLDLLGNNSLSWVQALTVSVDNQTLATYTRPVADTGSSNDLTLTVVMPADQLEPLLAAGPVNLSFTLTAMAPAQDTELSTNLCVAVSGKVDRHL